MNEITFEDKFGSNDKRLELAWAIEYLAKALTEDRILPCFTRIEQCQQYLIEFKNNYIAAPILSEKEANLSSELHAYMRKAMNCHLGSLLYSLISNGDGKGVWISFTKGLGNELNFRDGIEEAEKSYELDRSKENFIMLQSLWLWENNFKYAKKWLKNAEGA